MFLEEQIKKTGNGSLTSEIRFRLLNTIYKNKFFLPVELEKIQNLIYAISKIGNNINQIARIANAKGVIDVPHLKKEIDKLDEFIIEMKNKYLRPDKDE